MAPSRHQRHATALPGVGDRLSCHGLSSGVTCLGNGRTSDGSRAVEVGGGGGGKALVPETGLIFFLSSLDLEEPQCLCGTSWMPSVQGQNQDLGTWASGIDHALKSGVCWGCRNEGVAQMHKGRPTLAGSLPLLRAGTCRREDGGGDGGGHFLKGL